MVAALPPSAPTAAVAFLVEEVPEWEFKNGFFYVTWGGQRWAYPPAKYFAMLAHMAEVARQYRFGEGEVIAFPAKVPAEH